MPPKPVRRRSSSRAESSWRTRPSRRPEIVPEPSDKLALVVIILGGVGERCIAVLGRKVQVRVAPVAASTAAAGAALMKARRLGTGALVSTLFVSMISFSCSRGMRRAPPAGDRRRRL